MTRHSFPATTPPAGRPGAGDFSGWRTSSYGGGGNECVAVSRSRSGWARVRDTKRPGGGVLVVPGGALDALLAHLTC